MLKPWIMVIVLRNQPCLNITLEDIKRLLEQSSTHLKEGYAIIHQTEVIVKKWF